MAHAVNHFSDAAGLTLSSPLRRWAKAEAEYLRRLNNDEEYMELEISRISLFDNLVGVRRTSLRIFAFGIGLIAAGMTFSYILTNVGWAVSGLSLSVWTVTSLLRHMFASRIPFELLDKE